MRNVTISFLALIVLVFFISCQSAKQSNQANTSSTPAASGALKIKLETDPIFVEAGKDVEIIFTFKNEKDEVVKDLPYTKEDPMHMIAVAQDLSEYYDLALKPESDGTFRVHHTFPVAGRYTFFLDLMTADVKIDTQTIGFGIAGSEHPKQELKADEKLVKNAGDLRIELQPEGELAAGKPV